jgi:AhpD family alkylhydroperoxidase
MPFPASRSTVNREHFEAAGSSTIGSPADDIGANDITCLLRPEVIGSASIKETTKMSDSILSYEERMWQLTGSTKAQMPELADAYYGGVKNAVYKDGTIDLKTKRLMSLAVAIQAGCKDCMVTQTARALDLGATTEEIFETCSVAISMGGTLAWSKALVVADYLREKGLIE